MLSVGKDVVFGLALGVVEDEVGLQLLGRQHVVAPNTVRSPPTPQPSHMFQSFYLVILGVQCGNRVSEAVILVDIDIFLPAYFNENVDEKKGGHGAEDDGAAHDRPAVHPREHSLLHHTRTVHRLNHHPFSNSKGEPRNIWSTKFFPHFPLAERCIFRRPQLELNETSKPHGKPSIFPISSLPCTAV